MLPLDAGDVHPQLHRYWIAAAHWQSQHKRELSASHDGEHSLPRIRVVLSPMPRLLHDIVHSILTAESDIDVDDGSSHSAAPMSLEDVRNAHVVIVTEPEFLRMNYESLLYGNPRLRLVAVSGDGRSAALYELRPCRIPLGELSPQTLVDAVRLRSGYGSST